MNRCLFFSGLVSLFLTACSSTDASSPLGGFEYEKEKEGRGLVVPENLLKPETSDEYQITVEPVGEVGKDMDIRSPSLVLPVATSSRVEIGSSQAIVWFDQLVDEKDLYGTVKAALEKYVSSQQSTLTPVSGNDKKYQSSWIYDKEYAGLWGFESLKKVTGTKFNYTFDVKPHGRSVSLLVELNEFKQTTDEGTINKVTNVDKQRLEMAMLNQIIEEVGYDYQKYYREKRKERADKKLVRLSENSKDEASLLVDMTQDQLWDNINRFFVKHGFTVTDLNDSKKLYYVEYEKPSRSFWQFIWAEDVPVVDIDSGDYQFRLREVNDIQTMLTIYDNEGKALDIETMQRIFPVLEPGLSFRDLL